MDDIIKIVESIKKSGLLIDASEKYKTYSAKSKTNPSLKHT